MIRALEQQVAAWVQQVAAESSPLFGAPTAHPGTLDPSAVPANKTGVLVAVTRLVPAPEHRDLGPAPVTVADRSRLRVALTVLLVGPADPSAGLTVAPPGASVHQNDLLALTLLARLRERTRPGADGETGWHGGVRGSVSVRAGDRMADLRWEAVEAGEPVVVESVSPRRRWHLPLQATVEYALSALPVDGGRILAVGVHQDFVPAERLPLSYFAGMDGALVEKLNGAAIHRLGDLAGRNAEALAVQLQIADAYAKMVLTGVVTAATTRQSFEPLVVLNDTLLEAAWLPARALIAPTAGEETILNRARSKPMDAIALAALGLSTAAVLRPDLLETVLVGRLLAQERVA